MASTNKVIRDIIAFIDEQGGTLDGVERGKHIRFNVSKNGKKHVFFHSVSSSDHRGIKNFKSQIRRKLRE